MTEKGCPFCDGTGRYASPLTDWYAVTCERCNGTGDRPADFLRIERIRAIGTQAARAALAELDAIETEQAVSR